MSKLELGSKLNGCSTKKSGSVYQEKSGKWKAEIQKGKVRYKLGTYATAEDAMEALNRKKCELGLKEEDAEQSQKNQRLRCVYPRKSGRWQTEIRHPLTKAKIHLGTFDIAEEAKEANDSKRREFDSMFPGHKKRNQTKDSCDSKADPEQSQKIQRPCCAEEAYNSKRGEFDLMFPGSKKLKRLSDSCKGDAIAEGKIDSTCVSDDPSVSTRAHLGTSTKEAEEAYNNTMCEFGLMVHAHKKKASCEADATPEGKSDSTCVSDDRSISTRVHLGTSTEEAEEAYNNTVCEFGFMVLAHKKKASCEADATPNGKSDSTCVSGDPSISNRVHLGTFTEEAKEAYDSKQSNYRLDSHDLGLKAEAAEQSQKNQRLSHAYPTKSGQWRTVIGHPITKARIRLGTFNTAEEAKEAYDNKRCEFNSMFPGHYKRKQSKDCCELGLKADAKQSQKNQRLNHVYSTKSGRWRTEIGHPITKARIRLGTFDTAEEAKEAYDSKRCEFDSMFPGHYKRKQSKDSCELGLKADAEQSQKNQRLSHVYPRKSGRWTTEIRHPITRATIRLGTFDTAEEAKEAYDSKRREFDSMFPSCKKCTQTKDSCDLKAGPEQSQKIQRPCCAEETEEACNSKRREFDLMFPGNKKLKQSNDGFKGDAIAEAKSYSTCVSDYPSASSDGSLVIKTSKEEETGGSMLNENVQSVPMFLTEERGEFDSDVIDSYGQLVGEYSRLDDELWLCRSKDDATLEHDEGHECC